jgi:4'-phosphopantetheinyl transferase
MCVAKRRADWRLGRWTAKRAAAAYLNTSGHLREIEVRPEASGAPQVWIGSRPAPVTISLSHRDGAAVCAVAPASVALGCDLEVVETRSAAFLTDYFTDEEQAFLSQAPAPERPRLLALFWSAKESALKALRVGLRMDTRCVAVRAIDALQPSTDARGWRSLRVSCEGKSFDGWWRQTGLLVRTVVAAPPLRPPVEVQL